MSLTVYVFGNPDLPFDSLPVRILPELRLKFPRIIFITKDPNEEWVDIENLTLIDTIEGINQIRIFQDLDGFENAPSLTLHDFDALASLKFLKKLGKLKKVKIIGVPPMISEKEALDQISEILNSTLL